jgi:hypothetical protein
MSEEVTEIPDNERIYREVLIAVIATGLVALLPEVAIVGLVVSGSFLLVYRRVS